MGCYDGKSRLLRVAHQYCLCHGTADGGFRTTAEFVYQQQGGGICHLHHVLHVEQVAGVGGQVVLYALFVSNVYGQFMEDTHLAALAYGNWQAALQHVLYQAYGLQAHALAAGIWSGYDEYVLLPVQFDFQGHNLLALLLQ